MVQAAGYFLIVPRARRGVLLNEYKAGKYENPRITEPVTLFAHSRRAPLVVFASFNDGELTHIAAGRRGIAAGTELSRLTMTDMVELAQPITFEYLISKMPPRTTAHLARILSSGGVLPAKTFEALVDVLIGEDASLGAYLARFSSTRAARIKALSPEARENLGLQKETLTLAMHIAGVPTEPLTAWTPTDGDPAPLFLQGLAEVKTPEDAMLISDLSTFPGFRAFDKTQFAMVRFTSQRDPIRKLSVLMANRFALEEQTGADLLYYNETYKSFVLVQYKAMEKPNEHHEFRWKDGDQLAKEIAQMDITLATLSGIKNESTPDSFRFHDNPFFLKICPRFNFNPDDKGLYPGMYFPLEYWKLLASDDVTLGPKGGRVINFRTTKRRLSNSEFVTIVAGAWVGTTIPQSAALEPIIEEILKSNRTLTFAVKSDDPDDEGDAVERWLEDAATDLDGPEEVLA